LYILKKILKIDNISDIFSNLLCHFIACDAISFLKYFCLGTETRIGK